MKKTKSIASFALAVLVAGGISVSSTRSVHAEEVQDTKPKVEVAAGETQETKPNAEAATVGDDTKKDQEAAVEESAPTGNDVIEYAKQFIGTPYRNAGAAPGGFDCSGFTMYVYKHFNIELPHNAKEQTATGTVVSKADLQPGDLVFFGKSIYHVGIYVGNGQFIHAPKRGENVKIIDLKYMPDYNTARRIFPQ